LTKLRQATKKASEMKDKAMKKTIVLLVAIIAATASEAQTNQVLSRNAVGYTQVQIPPAKLALVRQSFEPVGGGTWTVANTLTNQLPSGSKCIIYDAVSQAYRSFTYSVIGGNGAWSQGTTTLARATGFFIQVPTNAAGTNYIVYLMGEVPDATTAPTTTVSVLNGLNLIGYGYPVDTAFSNLALKASLPPTSKLILYDSYLGYLSYTKSTLGGGTWPNAALTNIIKASQGFFIQSTQNVQWVESKPYTWP